MSRKKKISDEKQQVEDAEFKLLLDEVVRETKENSGNFVLDWKQNPDNYLLILDEGKDAKNLSNYGFYEKDTECLILIEEEWDVIETARQMLQVGVAVASTIPATKFL